MGILADEAADVGRCIFAQVALDDEQRVELLGELCLAAECLHQSVHVVRHEPCVLPGIAFGEVVGTVGRAERIERCAALARRRQTLNKTVLRVEVFLVELAALQEVLVVSLLAQELGHLSHAPVGQRILQSLGHGLVGLVLVEGDIAILLQLLHAALVEHGRGLHGLEGALAVLTGDIAFQHQVGQHGDAGIAHHAVGLVTHQVPHGQLALLLEDVQEGLRHVALFLWMNERLQRMGCAIGVPERQGSVVGEVALVDLAVGTAILTVDVVEHRGSRHRVVHGGIEDAAHVVVVGLDADLRQLVVPGLAGSLGSSGEVPSRQLSLQIQLRILHAHGRQCHLHQQRLGSILDDEHGRSVAVNLLKLHRLRELGHEEVFLSASPAHRVAVAADDGLALLLHLALGDVIPADALSEVEQQQSFLLVGTERIAMHAHALRGCQLDEHVRLAQLHGIIAWRDALRGVRERHQSLFLRRDGQQRYVAQVADARATEVLVAEADEHRVRVVVA